MNKLTNISKVIVVMLLLVVQSFSAIAQDKKLDPIDKLKWLESADPIADAHKAILKKDFRLHAVYGYSLIVPGTENSKLEELQERYGLNPIDGTTDKLLNEKHGRLNRLAFEYSRVYNREILKFHK